jgi:hypothetical protein
VKRGGSLGRLPPRWEGPGSGMRRGPHRSCD